LEKKCEGERSLRHTWEGKIKINLKEIGREDVK
jgi:hypothetical protein